MKMSGVSLKIRHQLTKRTQITTSETGYILQIHTDTMNLSKTPDFPWILYSKCGQNAAIRIFACGPFSFPKMCTVVLYFLFLLQSVEILWKVTVAVNVPYSITFASRSEKNHDDAEG